MTNTIPTDQLPVLDPELWTHLRDMDPRSHLFGQEFSTAQTLAKESGAVLSIEHIFPPESLEVPDGFKSRLLVRSGLELPSRQFEGVVHSLIIPRGSESMQLDVERLVTDSGKEVQLCDLRPLMTAQVQKSGPSERSQKERLTQAVFRDIKTFAETGTTRRSLRANGSVKYTPLGDSKVRAYWMPVKSDAGALVIARLADCGDSIGEEAKIYRSVFGIDL